jgi:hypothetical protein
LTLDTVLALDAGGRGTSAQAVATTGIVASHVNSYITGNDFGDPGSVYAGPLGKTLLAGVRQGVDIHAFGGVNLEELSRNAMQTSGVHAGRFSDTSTFGDFSNGFGQALNVLGQSHTAGGVPAAAVDFLLAQQCPAGAFRLSYDAARGCGDDAQADTDVTALSLQALLAVDRSPAVDTAIHLAVHWLLAHQDPATGGFGGAGPTAPINSNTTGLAAQALRAAGAGEAADRAASYVHTLELSTANAYGTPAAGEAGAIALNPATFADALSHGIAPGARDPWRRATAQAVLAYGLLAFGPAPTFVATDGARLLDTRPGTATVDGQEVSAGRMAAGTTLTVPVAGRGGVLTDATAVALTITAADSTGSGYLTVYPCGVARPNTSNVNFAAGAATANTVIAALAPNGTVCIFVAGSDTDLVADVDGFFPAGSDYDVIYPARLLDTRPGTATTDGRDAGAGRVAAGSTVVLPVGGRGGVPADAAAVALNVTAIDANGSGYLTAYPCDAARPNTSSINFSAGAVSANAVITKLAADGTVCLYVAGSDIQLVADADGSFAAGSDYEAIEPARLADTRPGTNTVDGTQAGAGRVVAGITVTLPVGGRGGVPADARAVVLNVTAVDGAGSGYLTVYPCDTPRPNTSTVNFTDGTTIANAVITALAADGSVCIYVAGSDIQLVADAVGSFM